MESMAPRVTGQLSSERSIYAASADVKRKDLQRGSLEASYSITFSSYQLLSAANSRRQTTR